MTNKGKKGNENILESEQWKIDFFALVKKKKGGTVVWSLQMDTTTAETDAICPQMLKKMCTDAKHLKPTESWVHVEGKCDTEISVLWAQSHHFQWQQLANRFCLSVKLWISKVVWSFSVLA